VEDVAAALVALLASDVSGPVNIASGQPVALKDIIKEIAIRLNGADLIRLGALTRSQEEPELLVADVRRLSREVGWSPQYDLSQGLERTIKWWEGRLAEENREP
jgi:nucleoside-diphosphate-sugar epimerase